MIMIKTQERSLYFLIHPELQRRRWDERLNQLKEAHERRKAKKVLIICGILIVSSIVFASSPGIILFIGAMLLSAKISKMF